MAIADAKYKFTYIDVGANGRVSDGGVFSRTSFFKSLSDGKLHLPPPESLCGRDIPIPYFNVADDAFALSYNLMKPYAHRNLSGLERIFNYRLSRARRFRFRVFGKPIHLEPEKVRKVTVASCALHDYLITRSNIYFNSTLVDRYDDKGNVANGEWRKNTESSFFRLETRNTFNNNLGKQIREELSQNFVNEGEVSFQYGCI